MKVFLTNTLSALKEKFLPIDKRNIRMYVCGPTVYDRPHIGNVRSCVVFDILYRILKYFYPQVTYVRNITDIDDKIIDRANENGETVESLTLRTIKEFHQDLNYLNCLSPTHEPRATDNVSNMIQMIENLIDSGNAYISKGHVYFDVVNHQYYGKLSKRKLVDQYIGKRIEISILKKHPLDFVLWKPAKKHEKIYFSSPWGNGRPGWHIECSAMSKKYLGDHFDIHGGGSDLIFPHHENEIAQSSCESKTNKLSKYWLHNGFLTVNGEKMSKSLRNIISIQDIIKQGISGNALRYFYLTTHFKKPLDYNLKTILDSQKSIEKFQKCFKKYSLQNLTKICTLPETFIEYIVDDMNTPLALSLLHRLANEGLNGNEGSAAKLFNCCKFLGIDIQNNLEDRYITPEVLELAEKRKRLKLNNNWEEADMIREKIENLGYSISDYKQEYKITKNNEKNFVG